MAHRKFEHDKIESVKPTWHGLEVISEKLEIDSCWLSQWDIQPRELHFPNGKVSPFKTLVCTDNEDILVGNPYRPSFRPLLNSEFLKMISDAIAGTGHKMTTCGSIRNRGRVFVSFELRGMEKFKAAGREFSAFLNFGNGHDKSSVLWVNTSNICTVCDNTFGFNLAAVENKDQSASQTEETDDLKASIRHTKNAAIKLPELSKMIDRAIGVQGEFAVELEKLANQPCNTNQAETLFAGYLGRGLKPDVELSTRAGNTVDRLVQLFQGGAGNNGENMADVFQGFTDFYSHESAGENKEKQFLSSEFGAGFSRKSDFWGIVRSAEKRAETMKHGEALLLNS